MSTTAEITQKYKNEHNLSYHAFAQALSVYTQPIRTYTYQAVRRWAEGERKPDYLVMREIYNKTAPGQWEHDFALEMMMVLKPEIWRAE